MQSQYNPTGFLSIYLFRGLGSTLRPNPILRTKNAVAEMLKELPAEILKRLATEALPSSARVPDRCKNIADSLFETSVALSDPNPPGTYYRGY